MQKCLLKNKKLFILDATAFCYRAYYAVKPLSTSTGMPTAAVLGFVNILLKIIKQQRPDYFAVAFDLPKPTFRHQDFKAYKINRVKMPEDLQKQIPVIKDIISAYGITSYQMEGFEADDIIATIVEKFKNQDLDICVISSDKDVLQLIDDNVFVFNPYKDDNLLDREYVLSTYGCSPASVIDVMTLMGDASDNIPGIEGIGMKTAVELVKTYGSVENLISNVNQIKKEKIKLAIENNIENIILYKKLVCLKRDVPIEIKLDDLLFEDKPNKEKIRSIFKVLEFKKLLSLYQDEQTKSDDRSFDVLDGISNLANLRKCITENKTIGFNLIDTSRLILVLGFEECYLFDLNDAKTKDFILSVFSQDDITIVGNNLKEQLLILVNFGIICLAKLFDTAVAAYVLDPDMPSYDLKELAVNFLDGVSLEDSRESNAVAKNIVINLSLMHLLIKKLQENKCEKLFFDIEMRLLTVLVNMEYRGIKVDVDYLKKLSAEFDHKQFGLTNEIYKQAGEEFNIQSPKQIGHILFEKLGLGFVKKTKTGYSTDNEVLNKLSKSHPLPALLLEFREISKLKSTYVDSLTNIVDSTDRVHTSFNQVGTRTGRLSSSDPNLQNIPIKTPLGQKIRRTFIADQNKGFKYLLSCDYSQIELRVLAHLSEDEVLKKAFLEDVDVHSYTAGLIYNVNLEDVTNEMRSLAKTINFGIIYGMSAHGLSLDLGITLKDAQLFIDSYFNRYKSVKKYLDDVIEYAKKNKYVNTIFNRRRYIYDIDSPNLYIRQLAERVALNTPIQGSAADLIKIAMIDIDKGLKDEGFGAELILQVHDELIFEVAEKELFRVYEFVVSKMENAVSLNVPLKVKSEYGLNWMDTKQIGGVS